MGMHVCTRAPRAGNDAPSICTQPMVLQAVGSTTVRVRTQRGMMRMWTAARQNMRCVFGFLLCVASHPKACQHSLEAGQRTRSVEQTTVHLSATPPHFAHVWPHFLCCFIRRHLYLAPPFQLDEAGGAGQAGGQTTFGLPDYWVPVACTGCQLHQPAAFSRWSQLVRQGGR